MFVVHSQRHRVNKPHLFSCGVFLSLFELCQLHTSQAFGAAPVSQAKVAASDQLTDQ